MSSQNRRAAGIRRAWGRGPIILKLESLEPRELLAASANSTLPDLVNSSFVSTPATADWGQTLEVDGRVKNQGAARRQPLLRSRFTRRPSGESTAIRYPLATYKSPRAWLPEHPFPIKRR